MIEGTFRGIPDSININQLEEPLSSLFDFLKFSSELNVIFKINLKAIIKFATTRASVGVSNLTIYTEYVFGNFLRSFNHNSVKLILFRIINKLLWFY